MTSIITNTQAPTKNKKIFFTGFPGFIGYNLIKELLSVNPQYEFKLLIESRLRELSETELQKLCGGNAQMRARFELIEGDITQPGLGLNSEATQRLKSQVTTFYHLAAIYDLAVPLETAHKINVDGTRHVLDFCAGIKNLERLVYFSTCYVAGARQGRIYEDELDRGQKFKNHYESTKFEAEKLVQMVWKDMPTVIIRPSIVVGHSQTGETRKYDGPYFPILLFLRLPKWLPMANIGPGNVFINIVPVDYIIRGTIGLAEQPHSLSKVYALADPSPMLVRDLWGLMLGLTGHEKPAMTLPLGLVKSLMGQQWIRQLLRMPREVLDYFETDVQFDVNNAVSALRPLGIHCPHASQYMANLIAFVKEHPQLEQIRKQIY